MGNCATNCSNCMGKDGEHAEFNMDNQQNGVATHVMDGHRGLGVTSQGPNDRDYTKLVLSKVRFIIKLQAAWRGHRARKLIHMLKAK